jgi:hypothetical protein
MAGIAAQPRPAIKRGIAYPKECAADPAFDHMVNSIYNGSRFEDLWLEEGVGTSQPGPKTSLKR